MKIYLNLSHPISIKHCFRCQKIFLQRFLRELFEKKTMQRERKKEKIQPIAMRGFSYFFIPSNPLAKEGALLLKPHIFHAENY